MKQGSRRILPVLTTAALIAFGACSDSPTWVPSPPPPGPDVTPPQRVVDPVLVYPVPGGDAVLQWVAPRDDDDHDRVASYDIRYAYSFPLDWDVSVDVDDPPEPGVQGTPQSYAIPDPTRGRDLYAAIRTIDAAGNVSPVSNVAHVRVVGHTLHATCVEVITGKPVQGLDALVTALHVYPHTSDAAGTFAQGDLAAGTVNVALRYGSSGTLYHDVNHAFTLSSDVDVTYQMIPFESTKLGIYDNMFSMFVAAAGLDQKQKKFKKWKEVPVALYMPPYVNGNGVDYQAVGMEAVARWEELTGLDLWYFVDSPPAVGVTFAYKTRAVMTPQVGITYHDNDADGYPLLDSVDIVNDFTDAAVLRTTMLHELGHTIRLAHLPYGYLMFGGQPLPPDPTPDEVRVVQLYSSLPNGLDVGVYDNSNPATGERR